MIGIGEPPGRHPVRLDVLGPGQRWGALIRWGRDDVTACLYGDDKKLPAKRTGLAWDGAMAKVLGWIHQEGKGNAEPPAQVPPWRRKGITWREYAELPRSHRTAIARGRE